MSTTIGFIGLGLIGGSLAKGLKRKDPDCKIIAYNRNKDVLHQAMLEKTIDEMTEEIGEAFDPCDIIFLCAPVEVNAESMKLVKPYLKESAILTDVGSTKSDIMKIAADLGLQKVFIGGHPMAGSERSGYAYSTDHLVENAYYVVTPFPETNAKKTVKLTELIHDLLAIPMVMDAEEHDRIVATVSHLPHLIAFALVNLLKKEDDEDHTMKQIAAGGFKDITRIAGSSPVMWEQICMNNKKAINELMDDYIDNLEELRAMINAGDEEGLLKSFGESGDFRRSMDNRSTGAIRREYSVYLDILDKPGTIASVVNIVAIHNLNLKNIGILHNREFEESVLKVDFYDEQSAEKAADVLTRNDFTAFKK